MSPPLVARALLSVTAAPAEAEFITGDLEGERRAAALRGMLLLAPADSWLTQWWRKPK